MKTNYFKILVILTLNLGLVLNVFAQNQVAEMKNKEIWQGVLTVPGTEIKVRIVYNLGFDESGKHIGTMDSPDENIYGIPLNKVIETEDSIEVRSKRIKMLYKGKKVSSEQLEGMFFQNGRGFELSLQKTDKVEKPKRPQEPKKPYPYREEEVSYENKSAGLTIAGTLTLPKDGNQFPAVLLITGSGPQNRDEALMGHKPFLVIADYLTRQGIAVLRVDDRGVGKSTGKFNKATSKDFASDVLAGVEYLGSREDIKAVGLAGHSEGGLIAPMVAVQSSDVEFIILLAGPGEPGSKILLDQGDLILKSNGMSDDFIAKMRPYRKKYFEIVLNEPDNEKAYKKIMAEGEKMMADLTEEEKAIFEKLNQGQEETQVKRLLSPWFRYFLKYDPKESLSKVKCPVLAFNGAKDIQVPSKSNLEAIEKHLQKAGNQNYLIKELSDLNHLFQHCKTGALTEYGSIEETFAPEALELIGNWILDLNL